MIRSFFPLISIVLSLAMMPLSLRTLNEWSGAAGENRSYLPSLQNRRTRKGFRDGPIGLLQYGNPEWVFIGDSMLGTRIDPKLLAELSGDGTRPAMFLFERATGPAWWYLSFKNHLVASGVRPRVTFFFFRDTNMTDTMFRLETLIGEALDEVAREQEPELDAVVAARRRGYWSGIDATLERVYQVNTAASWMHTSVRRWYAFWRYPDVAERLQFEQTIEDNFNENFRRDLATDMDATPDNPDFERDVSTSVLPLITDLANRHGLKVCFVRVQRRPEHNRPPPQSAALQRYVAEFRAWAQSQGACFHDDTGDPEMTLDLYEDGDHVLDRDRYTRIFRRRLDPLFR